MTKRRVGVNHLIIRDLASLYRSECFSLFGGQDWMHVLASVGTLDDLVMQCMNEACACIQVFMKAASPRGGFYF